MTNPVYPLTAQGAFGELLLAVRLWQYGIDLARFQIDSGVDGVAARPGGVRLVQVKTTRTRKPIRWPARAFDVLAVVVLPEDADYRNVGLHEVGLFLVPPRRRDGGDIPHDELEDFRLESMIDEIWPPTKEPHHPDQPVRFGNVTEEDLE